MSPRGARRRTNIKTLFLEDHLLSLCAPRMCVCCGHAQQMCSKVTNADCPIGRMRAFGALISVGKDILDYVPGPPTRPSSLLDLGNLKCNKVSRIPLSLDSDSADFGQQARVFFFGLVPFFLISSVESCTSEVNFVGGK